jgi:hypothetical protein
VRADAIVFLCVVCILAAEALIMIGQLHPPLVLATLTDVTAAAPIAFAAGLLVGFILADRYRLIRRRPTENDPP